MSEAAASKPPLRCRWGRHKPDPVARWNHGYYFSRCRRCGVDLVRTDYGRWEPPRGFRVVWRSSRPEHALGADLVEAVKIEAATPAPAPVPAPEPGEEELPIQAVLRQLEEEAQDEAAEAEDETGAETESEPAGERPSLPPEPSRPSRVPDFMDDPEMDSDWAGPPPAPRKAPSAPPPAAAPAVETPPDPPRFNPAFAGLVARACPAPDPAREEEQAAADEAEDDEAPPAAGNRRRAVMAGAGIVLMLFVAGLMGWGQGSFAGKGDPGSAPPQRVALGAGQPVFVTAGGLACRAEPGPGAAELRQLLRGDPVRLIARDGDWASIAHRGEQCWTPLRYLSVERPM